jgi:ATPase family associated with various cellular activities (AAA)
VTHFLKNGNTWRVASNSALDLHDQLPAGNYIIKADQFGNLFLEEIDGFTAPTKIYGDTLKTADRILHTFHDRPAATGVLLTGEKGSGKTLLSKMLSIKAAEQGIPTIVINHPWKGDAFNKLIQDIQQPCIVLFDEFEKVYDREAQEQMLTLLDGVFPSKTLFVLTCNDKWRIDTHMRNRPGRIYYSLDYAGLTMEFIEEYCDDCLHNLQHKDGVCKIASLFGAFNFDMLKALIEEMNRYGETAQEAMKLLNTKPEFANNDEYTVQLIVDNEPVEAKDVENNSKWSGNPLSGKIEIDVRDYDDDGEQDGWITYNWHGGDLSRVDPREGKFQFTNEDGIVVLTRVVKTKTNYFIDF